MENVPHDRVDLIYRGIKDQLRRWYQKTYENIPNKPKTKEENTSSPPQQQHYIPPGK